MSQKLTLGTAARRSATPTPDPSAAISKACRMSTFKSHGMQTAVSKLRRAAVLLALGVCSCSAVPPATGDPFAEIAPERPAQQAAPQLPQANAALDEASRVPSRNAAAVQQVAWQSAIENATANTNAATPTVRQRGLSRDLPTPAQPVSTFTPAEPRAELAAPGHARVPGPVVVPVEATSPVLYPDEYIFDGGDRALPVHYGPHYRHGLDTEDTIAEYTDHLGEEHVKPSNRVAVYSPRFASVRTISGHGAGVAVDRLASAYDTAYGKTFENRTAPTYHQQREGSRGVRMRSRPSGLESRNAGRGVAQTTRADGHEKLLNVYEDFAFLRTGRIEHSDEARLAAGIQAAFAWTRDQSPVITAVTISAHEVTANFAAAEVTGIDDSHKTPGRLRIVKLADKQIAKPGDVVTFTIRYDNLGDHELRQVRVVDNLTPRLEYVADSAASDRPATIAVEDNAEGSIVLTVQLDEPLPGKTGGVITFQALVR